MYELDRDGALFFFGLGTASPECARCAQAPTSEEARRAAEEGTGRNDHRWASSHGDYSAEEIVSLTSPSIGKGEYP
jgi:hypothetical protein